MLFYPVQYEGEELSKNIFYTAEAVNQQATPAVDYLLAQGKKKFYLIGTDYVYPQTTNLILYKYLLLHGVKLEDIGGGLRKDDSGKVISAGKYVPFGHTDFQQIVAPTSSNSPPAATPASSTPSTAIPTCPSSRKSPPPA
jgi:urea transport system substrate-binding protein